MISCIVVHMNMLDYIRYVDYSKGIQLIRPVFSEGYSYEEGVDIFEEALAELETSPDHQVATVVAGKTEDVMNDSTSTLIGSETPSGSVWWPVYIPNGEYFFRVPFGGYSSSQITWGQLWSQIRRWQASNSCSNRILRTNTEDAGDAGECDVRVWVRRFHHGESKRWVRGRVKFRVPACVLKSRKDKLEEEWGVSNCSNSNKETVTFLVTASTINIFFNDTWWRQGGNGNPAQLTNPAQWHCASTLPPRKSDIIDVCGHNLPLWFTTLKWKTSPVKV